MIDYHATLLKQRLTKHQKAVNARDWAEANRLWRECELLITIIRHMEDANERAAEGGAKRRAKRARNRDGNPSDEPVGGPDPAGTPQELHGRDA